MSSPSNALQSIIQNAERLANRLKDRQTLADRILAEAEGVNHQLEAMRQVSFNWNEMSMDQLIWFLF